MRRNGGYTFESQADWALGVLRSAAIYILAGVALGWWRGFVVGLGVNIAAVFLAALWGGFRGDFEPPSSGSNETPS